MNKVIFALLPSIIFATTCTKKLSEEELSMYETKQTIENREASQNTKIKCRLVCDKKIYKEQRISEAIEFYKNSKDYFNRSK